MGCKYLMRYTHSGNNWGVASCTGKEAPYVPSLKELRRFCQSTAHVFCPCNFLASRATPAVGRGTTAEAR